MVGCDLTEYDSNLWSQSGDVVSSPDARLQLGSKILVFLYDAFTLTSCSRFLSGFGEPFLGESLGNAVLQLLYLLFLYNDLLFEFGDTLRLLLDEYAVADRILTDALA